MKKNVSYVPLHLHSDASLLDGASKAEDIAARGKQLGMTSLALTDHGVVTNILKFQETLQKAGLKNLNGIEFYVPYKNAKIRDSTNRGSHHMVSFAKNYEGWKDLLKLVKMTNENFYYKPRLHLFSEEDSPGLDSILQKGNIISISGHQGSALSNNLFCDIFGDAEVELPKIKIAYSQYKNVKSDYYEQFLKPNWLEDTCELAKKMEEKLGGRGNFYIELQNELCETDLLPLWVQPIIVDCLRKVAKETGIPATASSDPHYAFPEQAEDQRFLVMNNMKETVQSVQRKLDSSDEMDLMVFFGSNNFYIHSHEEMAKNFTQEELAMTNTIADLCETYDIKEAPYIPKYVVPEMEFGQLPRQLPFKTDSDKYLYEIAVQGAKDKKPWEKTGISKQEYWDRLQEELKVFFEAGLSDYFLTVWDICMAADNRPADHSFDWRNWKGELDPIARGPGRGSVAGCLLAYMISISKVDSIKYGLSFARFYNAGRKGSLPDIDTDFDSDGREWVFEYLRHKYGSDKVGQISTFGAIKGKAAIKDVFRVAGVGTFEEVNEICKHIGEEAKIAGEIQDHKEAGDEDYNILTWSLDNIDEFKQYYEKEEYKPLIDQAIRCEGLYRQSGKHACGIVVSDKSLEESFPVVYDTKSKEMIIGLDMKDVEKAGGCKVDILAVSVLSKLKYAQQLINGEVKEKD